MSGNEEISISDISNKLSALNEQLARKAERNRKVVKCFSFLGIAAVGIYVILHIVITMIHLNKMRQIGEESSTGIIGGADGPTLVFVTSSALNAVPIIVMAAILIVSIIGLCTAHKK